VSQTREQGWKISERRIVLDAVVESTSTHQINVPDIALVISGRRVRKGLIDDIPRVATIAKVLHELGDVVDKHLGESLVGPWHSWAGDPVRQLGLPDQVMAANLLASGLSNVEEVVAAGKVERILLGLGIFELI